MGNSNSLLGTMRMTLKESRNNFSPCLFLKAENTHIILGLFNSFCYLKDKPLFLPQALQNLDNL